MSWIFQASLMILGTAITAVLGYSTVQSETRQAEAAERSEEAVKTSLFTQTYALAMEHCSETLLIQAFGSAGTIRIWKGLNIDDPQNEALFQQDLDEYSLAFDAKCDGPTTTSDVLELSEDGEAPPAPPIGASGETPLNSAEDAPDVFPPAPEGRPIARVTSTIAEKAKLRYEETRASRETTVVPRAQTHHALLASYRVGAEEEFAVYQVAKLERQLANLTTGADYAIRVYKTRNSNHYAVVLEEVGVTRDAEQALALVNFARENGLADDAFAQDENSWTLCNDASTEAGLRACG